MSRGTPDPLGDPARLRALADAGLGASPDPEMEFFADWVSRSLRAPIALVSLVQPREQVFPGARGLPEPWASKRSTPLSHSFCQHVVRGGEPVAISDAREQPPAGGSLAVSELGVVAYLGAPLTDGAGNVLGSLCAIDVEARRWEPEEVEELGRMATACSAELRLRLARVDADRERARHDHLEDALRRSFDRSQTLLSASQAFTETTTVQDVRARISELADSDLEPSYVGLSLLGEGGAMRRLFDRRFPPTGEASRPWGSYDLDSGFPSAVAVREQRIVHYADRADFDADQAEPVQRMLRELGLHALLAAPLHGPEGAIGALVLGWDRPRPMPVPDLVTVTAIASYAAQALGRARYLRHRESVAHELQRAMLTNLPSNPAVEMAARYQPADSRDNVGGDWYDAVWLADPHHPDDAVVALSVGDITGHTVEAAAVMGQVRSMLRQAAWDHPGEPPSHTFAAFERASSESDLQATGTAVVAHLRRQADGHWSMVWTNAGHPPPIVVGADGTTVQLDAHDTMFGHGLGAWPRVDHHLELEPGSTLFLYTDGLIERRGTRIDEALVELRAHLSRRRHLPVEDLVDDVVAFPDLTARDDVVVFAVRLPGTPAG